MNYLKYLFAVILVLSSLSLRAQPGDIPGKIATKILIHQPFYGTQSRPKMGRGVADW